MEKTKLFIEENSKWQILEEYVLRIESYKETDPFIAIENCKSLMESVFKTIIVEVTEKTANDLKNDNIGKLYSQVKIILNFKRGGYSQIIGSFSKIISQLRNKLGKTSHGKDIYTLQKNKDTLFRDEVNLLLHTADVIVFFLLNYYKNQYPALTKRKVELEYEESMEFNKWFDENEPLVAIKDLELSPSKVLFDNDIEAYKAYLIDYNQG
jgi:hypothetical protein